MDQDLVHLALGYTSGQHLGRDVLQNVRVAVAPVFGQAVLGVNVMRDNNPVLITLLHKEG